MRLVADRDVIHSAMRFGFGEDILLRPRPSWKANDIARVRSLAGDDDLEFVSVFNGSDRHPVLVSDLPSDGDEAVPALHDFSFQRVSKQSGPPQTAPSFPAFDRTLEGGKAPERHRDGEFDLRRMRFSDYGFVGEGAVDAGPDLEMKCARGEGTGVPGPYGG